MAVRKVTGGFRIGSPAQRGAVQQLLHGVSVHSSPQEAAAVAEAVNYLAAGRGVPSNTPASKQQNRGGGSGMPARALTPAGREDHAPVYPSSGVAKKATKALNLGFSPKRASTSAAAAAAGPAASSVARTSPPKQEAGLAQELLLNLHHPSTHRRTPSSRKPRSSQSPSLVTATSVAALLSPANAAAVAAVAPKAVLRSNSGRSGSVTARARPRREPARTLRQAAFHHSRCLSPAEGGGRSIAGASSGRRPKQAEELALLARLIECNPMVLQQVDAERRNLLHTAGANGRCDVIQLIVSGHNAIAPLCNELDRDGATALHLASQAGHLDACKALLQRDWLLPPRNSAPGSDAMKHAHRAIAAQSSCLNVKLKSGDRSTPQEVAEDSGHYDVSCFLASHSAAMAIAQHPTLDLPVAAAAVPSRTRIV